MRRLLTAAAFYLTLITIALFVSRSVQPGRHELELDIYILLVGTLAVFTAVLITREAFPPSTGSALTEALEVEPVEPVRPPDLERTERLLAISAATASAASCPERYPTATRAPARASSREIASPMPRAPPVTSATLPSSDPKSPFMRRRVPPRASAATRDRRPRRCGASRHTGAGGR